MGHLNFHNNAALNVFTLHINKDLKKCKVFFLVVQLGMVVLAT